MTVCFTSVQDAFLADFRLFSRFSSILASGLLEAKVDANYKNGINYRADVNMCNEVLQSTVVGRTKASPSLDTHDFCRPDSTYSGHS